MAFIDLFEKKCKVLEKKENSITFEVERFLPKPKQKLFFYDGEELEKRLQSDESLDNIENRCITSSFRNETLGYVGSDVLYKCMVNAFADHRPIILSPDMIWLVLCQAFSHHIKLNHKKYRSRIVRHKGFKTLKIITTSDLLSEAADWESVFYDFFTEIDNNTKNGIASVIESNFSTTGINERIASQITLMDITKQFFRFEAFYMICGIPQITLEGTPEDWERIIDKFTLFDQFGLNQWTKDLRPIISEFIKTANGDPDAKFWRTMIKKSHLWPLKGPNCGPNSKPSKFDGWFLKFFPFDRGGEKTKNAYYIISDMLPEFVNVDMKYNIIDASGILRKSYDLELFSGFVGVEENPKTKALRPKIGWMVCYAISSGNCSARV